jgi:uncharacterized protein YccT (UPF0319 family)
MTALEMRQEFEGEFAADARLDRERLAAAMATLSEKSLETLETLLTAEYESQLGEYDVKASRASVTRCVAARNEAERAIRAVASACGVKL